MLWVRYALLGLKPDLSLESIYAKYLESPGTKAYTISEAKDMLNDFRSVEIQIVLTHGDLLTSSVGQRHRGAILSFAKIIWPRWLIHSRFRDYGLFMLIRAEK